MIETATQTTVNQAKRSLMSWLPAAFMLLFFGAGFIMILVTPSTFKSLDKPILNGQWAVAYEAALNDAIPLKQLSIDTWGVIEYGLFKDGREGVLVGKDNWLFTDEEFTYHPEGQKAMQGKLELASSVQTKLAEQGINLLIAVIPSKARLYSEYLGRYSFPTYNQATYTTFLSELKARNIPVVGLLEPLQDVKSEQAVFLKTDTHWTPYGASVAAQTIANTVNEQDLLASFGSSAFETSLLETTEHKGDLLNFIPLGALQKTLGPSFDALPLYESVAPISTGGLGLFDSQSIPVTLVGTSYSANALWSFEASLKTALGADVLNAADEGAGPVKPMRAYLESLNDLAELPELVIWEIPERYLFASE